MVGQVKFKNTRLERRNKESAYVAAAGCCSNASLGSLGTGGFFLPTPRKERERHQHYKKKH